MTLEFTPLSAHVGLAVHGIDLDSPISSDVGERLQAAFIQAGILVFPEAGTSPEAHLTLSRCFGELQRHPAKENWVAGYPELVDISYRPGSESESSVALYEVDGERRGGWLPWHADLMFMDKINRGGILRAITLPRAGGRTGFIDRIAAYDRLPDPLKRQIEELHVVYQLRPDFTFEKFGKPPNLKLVANSPSMASLATRIERDFRPVLHPMVFRQAETGRKVLNVSPTSALGIHEMPGEEGDALLTEIVSCMLDPSDAYFHEWRKNDLVLWDNWRTLHCAEGVPEDCTREMQRTTITGDYALGRKLNEARI
ncbi:MAG TPA: TauD/TfdA family dioxygenase [Alphaproteobacteria bacterium]|nr:TauD/TfdA family dioxygenase [Alphaproteobacteria bacterium]